MSLSVPATSFIGRTAEVASVAYLLQDHRLVTLTGPGGAGKTRLALAAVDAFRQVNPSEVVVVPLANVTTADRVPSAIASALDIREPAHGATVDTLVNTIADRSLLLLLDNLEQVADAAPALAWLLNVCPSLRILVTSRVPLRLSMEKLLAVPPLGVPPEASSATAFLESDAVRLFVDRARAVRPDFDLAPVTLATIGDLCRRLDGLPLAIELAAARTRHLTPAAILDRMDHQLRILTGGPRDAPERQQTMQATISWSYALLTAGQQRHFRQLAVFRGGWSLPAVEAVAGEDVLDDLAALVDHSLVQLSTNNDGTARYRMLEPIREFAWDQLQAAGETIETQRVAAAFFTQRVEDGEPPTYWSPISDDWLQECARELPNLRAALDWYLEHDPALALRLAGSLYWFWRMQGHLTEGRRLLETAIRLSVDRPELLLAKALASLGDLACWQSDFDEADRAYLEGLERYLVLNELDGIGRTRYGLGRSAQFRGDADLARDRYEECVAFYAAIGDARGLGSSTFNLAATIAQIGDLERAAQLYEEAMAQAPREDSATYSIGLSNLAGLAVQQQDWSRVIHYSHEALRLFDVGGDLLHIIECLEHVAVVLRVSGQPERAARIWGTTEAQRQRIGYDRLPADQIEKSGEPAALRQALGPEVYEAELARGRSMSLEDAVAEALTVEVPPAAPAVQTPADRLSKREREVLRGLVDGKTNQEIAAELFISHHTVMNHVTSILNKLGLESRTAAATYAVRHGLV